jgi:4,5-DOPA dioxygenase extradiol
MKPMPVLFVGHGSPMNAIQDNEFSREWIAIGQKIPTPKAILVISAHWITPGETKVTAMDKPETIHDFGGFPQKLYEQQYPAPGTPEYAKKTIELIKRVKVLPDYDWGLDHGTWSVLLKMYPEAKIPVYQLSIDYSQPLQYHYDLAKELQPLRYEGILIIGSGNLVHNLLTLRYHQPPYDWAIEFDQKITTFIDQGNDQAVVDFQKLGRLAQLAHPMYDHFLPLIYALALRETNDQVEYFNSAFDMSSISMRSFILSASL